MEGVGSRQSRAASRYASSPSAPVFSGPVRKWKKQWVSSQPNNQINGNNRNQSPPLLLRRWTPLAADEPRKRRRRYAPVVPIEKGNMEGAEKVDSEAGTSTKNQSSNGDDDAMLEKLTTGEAQEQSEDKADPYKSLIQGFCFEDERELSPILQ